MGRQGVPGSGSRARCRRASSSWRRAVELTELEPPDIGPPPFLIAKGRHRERQKASKAARRRWTSQDGSSRPLRNVSKVASANPPVAVDDVVADALLITDSVSRKKEHRRHHERRHLDRRTGSTMISARFHSRAGHGGQIARVAPDEQPVQAAATCWWRRAGTSPARFRRPISRPTLPSGAESACSSRRRTPSAAP